MGNHPNKGSTLFKHIFRLSYLGQKFLIFQRKNSSGRTVRGSNVHGIAVRFLEEREREGGRLYSLFVAADVSNGYYKARETL